MKTYKISPDDLIQGDEGRVESSEALVDGLEVGVADVNHRVVGVQSAELKWQPKFYYHPNRGGVAILLTCATTFPTTFWQCSWNEETLWSVGRNFASDTYK